MHRSSRVAFLALWPKFKALGHATRVEIVAIVAAARKPPCASDIEAHFALAQPTLSHHLDILRHTGVLRAERRGSRVHYTIDAELGPALVAFVHELRAHHPGGGG